MAINVSPIRIQMIVLKYSSTDIVRPAFMYCVNANI
jgi:hypothetical protein